MVSPYLRIKVHHIRGKCPLARPLTMQNFVVIRQELSEISAIKNLCSQKMDHNSPKSLLLPPKIPVMLNFIDIGETTLAKSVTKMFLHPSIFCSPGGPPGPKVTGLDGGVHQFPLAIYKILSRSDDPCPRYLLPNFVDFVAGMTHKKYSK